MGIKKCKEIGKIPTSIAIDTWAVDFVLLDENENITREKLEIIKNVLMSDYCTVRYQYVKVCSNPVKGGNKVALTISNLTSKMIDGTQMWLLQPIDRTKNIYGINIRVNRTIKTIAIECVGKGFDVSDLNRGNISPHESIYFDYPIEFGWQNEWWKFIKISFTSSNQFQSDKFSRLKKLNDFGLNPSLDIFDDKYKPLPFDIVEKLIYYILKIDENWMLSDEYVVSISMNIDGKLVFGDIQTPSGKMKILLKKHMNTLHIGHKDYKK